MKVPCCRVYSTGGLSTWGKQFLTTLQQSNVLEVTYEPDAEKTGQKTGMTATLGAVPILMVENIQESKQTLLRLRGSGRRFLILWFGRAFSKEDWIFALENRLYCVFEHARAEDKKVLEWLQKAAQGSESADQFDHVIHSLKTLIIQGESDDATKLLMNEIKAAVGKLESLGFHNELLGGASGSSKPSEVRLPLHSTQDLGDALSTVHDLERTGVLWVRGGLPNQEGKVEFLQGKMISAVSGETRGLKAIYRMFLWDEPRFLFTRRDPQDCVVEEPLTDGMEYICLEGEGLRRRFEGIRRELPPSELAVEMDPNSLHIGTQLTPDDFSTLASVVEFRQVAHVIDYNPLPDVVLYESLIRLKRSNMIRVLAG